MATQGAILYDPSTNLMIGYVHPTEDAELLSAVYLQNGMQQKIVDILKITETNDEQKQAILWTILGVIPYAANLNASAELSGKS